jgi:hypothetical protein
VIRGIGLAAGGLAGGFRVKEALFKFEGDSHKVDSYFAERGFPNHQITKERFQELSPHRFNNLLGQEHNLEINIINDEEVLAEVFFDSSHELISLEISDERSFPGSLSVVEVQYDDFEYQVPIIGTELNKKAKLDLGMVSDPSYLRLMRTAASQDTVIPQNGISLRSITGDPLYQAIVQCAPKMGMRRDNYLNFSYATDKEDEQIALTNDMLLHYPVEVRENDKGDIALVYWGLYSAEDGGRGRNPIALYNDYNHRVYDVDIVQTVILNNDFQLVEMAHQEDNKKGSHQMVVDFVSRAGTPPFDQALHSAPNHGLVGRGLETIKGEEIKKIWRPFPVIDLVLEDGERDDMYWGARVVALKENLAEIDRKTSLLNTDASGINIYAINELEVRKKFLEDKLDSEIK